MDFSFTAYLSENFITLLVLAGLIVIIISNDTPLEVAKNYIPTIICILVDTVVVFLEVWASHNPGHETLRFWMSVINYIMIPAILLFEVILIAPSKLARNLAIIPAAVNSIIYLLSPLTDGFVFKINEHNQFVRGPLGYTIYIVNIVYLFVLFNFTFSYIKRYNRRSGLIIIYIIIAASFTNILEYLNIITSYVCDVYSLMLLFYYVFLCVLYESDIRKDLALTELKLSQERVKLLQEQIQPHFIFNSLYVIKGLIRKDPKRAARSVEDFSDYLRANVNAIKSNELIPFDEELTHIEAFIALELANEEVQVDVEYDLQETDFRIPPLTVEPLVENAFKYGVSKQGGKIWISTQKGEDHVVITVKDNGTGSKNQTKQEIDRIGIGLDNVRSRLELKSNSILETDIQDSGSTFTIYLPTD